MLKRAEGMMISEYERCTGCSVCVAICPKSAIHMVEDATTHFRYPCVDEAKCVSCGACHNVCPAISQHFDLLEPIYVYAANNKNLEERMISASGGIFRVLAYHVIDCGGAVAGVKYDGVKKCKHYIATKKEELDILCGTKYFQSESEGIYQALAKHAANCSLLMFCGTPCQAAAIKNYAVISGFEEKLLVVEILCRGISAAFLHQRFIKHLEDKHEKRIVSIQYKEKTKGWNKYGTRIQFEDGEEVYIAADDNYLLKLSYGMNLSIRESCFRCPYKRRERVSDITIGDFWKLDDARLIDNLGTSFLMVNSQNGKELFNSISNRLDYVESDLNTVMNGNKNGFQQVRCEVNYREYLWKCLNEGCDIGEATEKTQNLSLIAKVKRQKRLIDRDNRIMALYERWIMGHIHGDHICVFLRDNGFEHIAIYGYGTLGKALYEVVRSCGICVDYIIEADDKKHNNSIGIFVRPEDVFARVDAVIVTAINDYNDIVERLKERLSCPLLSMEDIVP